MMVMCRNGAPITVPPRHVPTRFRRNRDGHGIVAVCAAGAAAVNARGTHPAAGPEAMSPDGVAGEFAAGGRVAAGAAHKHAERIAIALDEHPGRKLEGKVDDPPEC